MKKRGVLFLVFLLFCSFAWAENPGPGSNDLALGIPIGGAEEVNFDLCPEGARVVGIFLDAWSRGDHLTMYKLLDGVDKKGYPFERAKFDFQFLEYKPYKISSIRQDGENFEFILSYGDWRDGDKDTKKMLVNGKNFKIVMSSGNSPFKESIEDYF